MGRVLRAPTGCRVRIADRDLADPAIGIDGQLLCVRDARGIIRGWSA